MKQRKKRPAPPPSPVVVDPEEMKKKMESDDPPEMPPMQSAFVDLDTPVYLECHEAAQALQQQTAEEGFVLLKNTGVLPLTGRKLNIFGRYAKLVFDPALYLEHGIEINRALWDYYAAYKTRDAGYTGSGWDEETNT